MKKLFVSASLFMTTVSFAADPFDPPSQLYLNNGGTNKINGSGNIVVECSVASLGKRSDAGHDLASFKDGGQGNALGASTYIEGTFPACRPGMPCTNGQDYMTRSQHGYEERTVVEVVCGLEKFDIFKVNGSGDVIEDHQIYQNEVLTGLDYCNPVVAETSAAGPPTDANHPCMGKETGTNFQGGKYVEWEKYYREDLPPVTDPSTGITTTPPPIYHATGTKYFKDVLTGKIIKDSRVSGSSIHRVIQFGKSFGSTNINDYHYYVNDTKWARADVKWQLNDFKVNIYKNGSALNTDETSCESSSGVCQEGLKLKTKGTGGPDTSVTDINGDQRLKFLAVIRNRGGVENNVEFTARVAGRVSVLKPDGTPLFAETANKVVGVDADGGFSHEDYNEALSVMLEDPIDMTDLADVTCEMQWPGKTSDKSGDKYLGQSAGVDLWSVGPNTFKINVMPILKGNIPDYLAYPNRNDVIYPSGQAASPIEANDGASEKAKKALISGVVDLAEVDMEYPVQAKINLGGDSDKEITCKKVKLVRPPEPKSIGLTPYNECGVFTAIREYYFDGNITNPLEIPGTEDAVLPPQTAPLIGLYNTAQWGMERTTAPKINKDEELQIKYLNGEPDMPNNPLRRLYPHTYVLVRPFTKKGIEPPIMYGEIGSNLRQVHLKPTDGVDVQAMVNESLPLEEGETDREVINHMVVVEIIAKGSVPTGDTSPESLRFAYEAGADKPLAFASGSCLAKNPFYLPIKRQGDEPVRFPAALENASLCQYSIPVPLKDIWDGLANLQVLSLAPRSRLDTYPVELMKRSATTQSCSKNAAGSSTDCWDIKSYIPAAASDSPKFKHADCHTRVCKEYTTTYPCGPYGKNTCTSPTPKTICHDEYKATCSVLENTSENECNANMAFRFDGYFNQMVASLGCVATYDGVDIYNEQIRDPANASEKVSLSDVAVSATLFGEGIIPYQEATNTETTDSTATGGSIGGVEIKKTMSMGGADPAAYNNYPDDKIQKGHAAQGGDKLGYACIPCQFKLPWLEGGFDVAPVPLDQGSTQNPRKPVYRFTKRQEPSECVKSTTFQVRYFGSGACNGIDAPPGHMCASRNLQPKNCPASSNGNVAGEFTVNLCSGSQFGTSNVSASWSPILIDVSGRSIEVSRSAEEAVEFDMQGKGKKQLVDWPMNTYDVALLVEPDANGQVTSAHQLFGDLGFKHGFDKLKQKYDKDAKGKSDGKINMYDVNFQKLKLWFDYNRNGISDPGEIQELAEHGVHELPVHFVRSDGDDLAAQTLSSTYFNQKDQRYMNVVDAYFGTHASRELASEEEVSMMRRIKD